MEREFPQLMYPIPLEATPLDADELSEVDTLVEQGVITQDEADALLHPTSAQILQEDLASLGILDDFVRLMDTEQAE